MPASQGSRSPCSSRICSVRAASLWINGAIVRFPNKHGKMSLRCSAHYCKFNAAQRAACRRNARLLSASERCAIAEHFQFAFCKLRPGLAGGSADRTIGTVEQRHEVFQVAVMRKHPVAAPQLAHEGVTIFQRDAALGYLADMRDHIFRFDRPALDQLGNRRSYRRLVIDEMPHAGAFEKSDAPAVVMRIGAPAACGKAGETEHDVGRHVAIHSEKLAQDESVNPKAKLVSEHENIV